MEISETKCGTTLVIMPSGRLNADSAQVFQECVLARIAAGEACVLLDLAELEYISSAGLRSLLIATKRAQAADGRLAVCGLTASVDEVFRTSGFDGILEVHPDRDTALRSLA